MAITEAQKAQFNALIAAAKAGTLVLMEVTGPNGEPAVIACACETVEPNSVDTIPLAIVAPTESIMAIYKPPEGMEEAEVDPTPGDLKPKGNRYVTYKDIDALTIGDGDLTISIDTNAQKWAVFHDHNDLVRDFDPYETPEQAEKLARLYCASKGDNNPKVVKPEITSVKFG